MTMRPSVNKGLRFVENAFGVFGYLLSGTIAAFIVVLVLYYAFASMTTGGQLSVTTTETVRQTASSTGSPLADILAIAFAMVVTFSVLIIIALALARAVRWFARTCSKGTHTLTRIVFAKKYDTRQFILVKTLAFAVQAGILLGVYIVAPSVVMFGFLLIGALLLVASLVCVAIQAVIVLSVRRAPADIL